MLRRLVLTLSILMIAATSALAAGRPPTANELASLERDVAAFVKATEKNKAADIIDALPPRVIPVFTENSNLSAKDMRDTLIHNTRAFGHQAKPKNLSADLSGLTLRDAKTRKNGTLSWGQITLSGTAMNGSKRVPFAASTLALFQEGRWYFARIDAAGQTEMIRMAYPELKGLPKSR